MRRRITALFVYSGSAPKVSSVLSIFRGRFGTRTIMKKKEKKKKVSSTFPSTVVAGRKSQGMLDCTQGTEVWISKRSRVCIFPPCLCLCNRRRDCVCPATDVAEYIASKQQISYFRKNVSIENAIPPRVSAIQSIRRSLPFLIFFFYSLSRFLLPGLCSPPSLFPDLQVKFRAGGAGKRFGWLDDYRRWRHAQRERETLLEIDESEYDVRRCGLHA